MDLYIEITIKMKIFIYFFIIANYTPICSFRVNNNQLKSNLFSHQIKDDRNRLNIRENLFKMGSIQEGVVDDVLISNSEGISEENGAVDIDKSDEMKMVDVEEEKPLLENTNSRFYVDKSIIYTIPHDDYVVIGQILTTYGLKGHVKVKSYTSQPEVRLREPGYRYLKIPFNDEKVIPIKLEWGRNSGIKDVYIVKFEGFDSVAQAQRLSNAYVTIPLSQMPPLEEDTYYARDLIGLDLYLYNDINKTKLGKIVKFIHHSDLASRKKFEPVCDDLIDVQMDMKLSLQTLIDVTKASKQIRDQEPDKNVKGPDIVTERELENADEVIDMYNEFQTPNFKSMVYVKYYECSICTREFTNHTEALLHEKSHDSKAREAVVNEVGSIDASAEPSQTEALDKDDQKLTVISIEDIIEKQIKKPMRRFYVPLVRNETVKYIDVENKSVYVDPYTIFIGEDPNRT